MINHPECRPGSKVLLIGTGGGNDIVSATIPAYYLHQLGVRTDIAGVLSPAAVHTFSGLPEGVVNPVTSNAKRFLQLRHSKEVSFIDAKLAEILGKSGSGVDDLYDFSVRFGTRRLVQEVNDFVRRKSYDLVIGVDVGGDILARGEEDPFLLSPAIDHAMLHLLGELEVPSVLCEFGLGTDGELRPEGMREILDEIKASSLLLEEYDLEIDHFAVKKFQSVNDEVAKVRRGHTGTMLLRTLGEKYSGKDIISEYHHLSRVGERKWYTPFEVVLPGEYAGKAYMIDVKKLSAQRKKTAFPFVNPLEQQLKIKMNHGWKTEMDMFSLWSGNNWTTTQRDQYSLFLLTPSTHIAQEQRIEILHEGLLELRRGNVDVLLVHEFDMEHLETKDLHVVRAGSFLLISCEDVTAEYLEGLGQEIEGYKG